MSSERDLGKRASAESAEDARLDPMWRCECGAEATTRMCGICGTRRDMMTLGWYEDVYGWQVYGWHASRRVEGTVPAQWLLDEKVRRQDAEAECERLQKRLRVLEDLFGGGA